MSIETRISRLVKKTGVKKSRWTVRLNHHGHEHPAWEGTYLEEFFF